MIRSLSQKKFRDELGLFVAEGEKCVSELTGHFELVLRADSTNATRTELEQMSNLRSPQGVVGVFKQPVNHPLVTRSIPENGLVLALDGVQDPGNLGTIIRTADWFGIHTIVCSRETADCYSPKVVQATMGSLGRVDVVYVENLAEWISLYAREGVPVYGTLLEGRDMYEPGAIADKQKGIIVMGNEGNGLSEAVRAIVSHPLRIPSYPANAETAESLNVAIATAVVLAEFRRGI